MSKLFVYGITLLTSCVSLQVHAAAGSKYSQKFKDQKPFFYAVLAEAAYNGSCKSAQKTVNRFLDPGKATVIGHREFKNQAFGRTNIILVKDDRDRLYVAFEGSTEGRNWVGNISMALRGAVSDYAVPHGIRKKMHRTIKGWEKSYSESTLVAVIGHSQGGLYASEVVRSHHQHYTEPLKDKKTGKIDRSKRQGRTNVVTFNAFLPFKKGNQYHFKTKSEFASTLFSPSHYYIKIKKSGSPLSIASNHGLKYALRGLKDKDWSDYKI